MIYRHKKTGGVYQVLADDARLEAEGANGTRYVVYRSVHTAAATWVRPYYEFHDGRFELIDDCLPTDRGSDHDRR